MRNDEPTLSALAARVDDLARRLAALEADSAHGPRGIDGSGGRSDADVRDQRPALDIDPEVFWVLAGLRERTDDDGGVIFAGSVRLPRGGAVEWQQGAESSAALESDWSVAADVLAALGHPIRLRLLREVLHGRRTAAELGAVEDLGTTGQLYHHLRQLVSAGWLRSGGRGRYEVPAPRVIPLLIMIVAAQR